MGKFEEGQLHSGSKTGPVVKDKKQALAIALKYKPAPQGGGLMKPKQSTKGSAFEGM